jgi:hypothetical protein
MKAAHPRSTFRRLVLAVLVVGILGVLAAGSWAVWCFRDRSRGYQLNIAIDGKDAANINGQFRAGFGRQLITPDVSATNEPVWIAGFSSGKAATSIHDDLWAIACVLDDGVTRVGVVAIDAIGFMHDDVVTVRRRVPASLRLDYVIVCSTHVHSAPDLIGIWGPKIYRTGVDPGYLEKVIADCVRSLEVAAKSLEPAQLALHEIATPTAGLVNDTRPPEVFDPDIRVMAFTRPGRTNVIGSIVSWANHPEAVWSANTEITADFPAYIRETLERGVVTNGKPAVSGLGGVHLYINGAVGGLMTPNPPLVVRDPFTQENISKPSHEKARALGRAVANRILTRLAETNGTVNVNPRIAVYAKTIELPLDNKNFLIAPLLGVIDRGHVRWKKVRSEAALLTIGDASIAAIPGEIYPEIVNGGVVRAPGGDFPVDPIEIPPIRQLMPGTIKFVFGLANDEVGYIIPKSEWDEKAPYLFDSHKPLYGEINSLGPETAGLIHTAIRELIQKQQGK